MLAGLEGGGGQIAQGVEVTHARAAASRAQGASPRARVPPMDYGDKLPSRPLVHFYAAVDNMSRSFPCAVNGTSNHQTIRQPQRKFTLAAYPVETGRS